MFNTDPKNRTVLFFEIGTVLCYFYDCVLIISFLFFKFYLNKVFVTFDKFD